MFSVFHIYTFQILQFCAVRVFLDISSVTDEIVWRLQVQAREMNSWCGLDTESEEHQPSKKAKQEQQGQQLKLTGGDTSVTQTQVDKLVMCWKTLAKKIEEEYNQMASGIKEQLKETTAVCTTADIWSVNTQSYLGMTAHWITGNYLLSINSSWKDNQWLWHAAVSWQPYIQQKYCWSH